MEAVTRGRDVFIKMVEDILCRKEENESVRISEKTLPGDAQPSWVA